jgi:glycosyltransferase involved in cell wall biosynthesis
MRNHISPVISIITVVYNAAETLEHTIKSVINQTYANIQYVVIDGESTDGSKEILERYKDHISILISEKDYGIYDAMNKALRNATGDWAYFLGADDLLITPTIISELVEMFDNKNNIYYGNTYLKSNNRIYLGKVHLMKLSLCNISHQAIFYPRSIYSTKQYNLRYKYFADHVYNLELYAQDKQRFTYIPKLISVYNDQGRSSTIKDVNYATDIVRIIYNNFGLSLSMYVWLRRRVAAFKNSLIN